MKAPTSGRGTPRPMEVWNADLPFDGRDGSKNRPVIVMGKSGGSYDVLMVTTHPHQQGEFYRPFEPYEAGLDSRSYVRVDKKFRIEASRFNYLVGELGDDDAATVRSRYSRMRAQRWTQKGWRRRSHPLRPAPCASTCASSRSPCYR